MNNSTALLLIDVQQGFDHPKWGARNNLEAEANMARVLAAWRARGWPVFHVKHNSRSPQAPLNPANPGNAIKPIVAPRAGEPIFEKTVNSAFIGTTLERSLRDAGVASLVIMGLTTPHCVSTTTRMGANLGFAVTLLSDATAAFEWTAHDGRRLTPDEVHYHALATLHGEFADVVTTDALLKTLPA